MNNKSTWVLAPSHANLLDESNKFIVIAKCCFGPSAQLTITHIPHKDVTTGEVTLTSPGDGSIFVYTIPTIDAFAMQSAMPVIKFKQQVIDELWTIRVFEEQLSGLVTVTCKDTIPDDWYGINVSDITIFDHHNLVGKMYDRREGLVVDPGSNIDSLSSLEEFHIITGDEEDFMPPPLIIP